MDTDAEIRGEIWIGTLLIKSRMGTANGHECTRTEEGLGEVLKMANGRLVENLLPDSLSGDIGVHSFTRG